MSASPKSRREEPTRGSSHRSGPTEYTLSDEVAQYPAENHTRDDETLLWQTNAVTVEPNQTQTSGAAASSSSSGSVKWLYPQELLSSFNMSATTADNPSSKDELPTQHAASSSATTTGGPDSDTGSVDELPVDSNGGAVGHPETDPGDGGHGVDEITQKMTASANYLGSMFSSAWKTTTKTANDATSNSSNLLSSALSKVTTVNKHDEDESHDPEEAVNGGDKSKDSQETTKDGNEASFFTSAWNTLGFSKAPTEAGDVGSENLANDPSSESTTGGEADEQPSVYGGLAGFSSALSAVGKAATGASNVFKDKIGTVGTTNLISEFNKEQESFIKTNENGHVGVGLAPWIGYNSEDELKGKILALSEDRRTFVRAPPSGMTFEFDYSSVSSTAMALLQEDPNLQKMRYELVPKKVKEEDFWRNYFYRVSLIKQSFELKDLEQDEMTSSKKEKAVKSGQQQADIQEDLDMSHDNVDDEFVSESYQASTSDIAEAEESIKNLGVSAKGNEEWEAELEGELNEFEVVDGKEEDNPEWENEIQDMLDEEETSLK